MKKAVLIMGIIGMLSTLFGCAKETPSEQNGVIGEDFSVETPGEYKEIESFYFSVSGYIPGYSYDLHPDTKNPDKTIMLVNDFENGMEDKKVKVDQNTKDALSKMCAELNILSWDGYHEVATDVLDGYGFALRIRFTDKTEVNAGGDNAFPVNYDLFSQKTREILQP